MSSNTLVCARAGRRAFIRSGLAAAAAAVLALLVGVPDASAQRRGGFGHGGHAFGPARAVARPVGGFRSAVPRPSIAPRSFTSGRVAIPSARPYGAVRGGVVVGRAVPRVGGRVFVSAPLRFYRPYYVFRPRVSLGVGLWVGFPVAYPFFYGYYAYPYDYPYPAYPYPYPYPPYPPYGYPYPPSGYSSQAAVGGLSFEITPSDAEVWVDGAYVGTVGDFTPTTRPLDLTPGRHHIEIRASGYRSMSFDVEISAGQVIPYRGALQPQ